MSSFYSQEELYQLGFKHIGSNINISRFSRLYNIKNMSIGNNVRIDDFCILSAGSAPFILENYIHIAAGVYIYGQYGFHMKSFTNISAGCKIYTQTDTFSGDCMVGSCIPNELRKIKGAPLTLEEHTCVGAGSIILPGVTIGEGCVIGANSLVNKDCKEWHIYVGSPAKLLKARNNGCKALSLSLI